MLRYGLKKYKGTSSHEWLTRQMKDPYVEKAKMMNYRCRSAFKLLEMNEKYNFLYPGQHVVECGAAPGSWTQVLVKETNSSGRDPEKPVGKVISVDKLPIYHVEGAHIFGGLDFTSTSFHNSVLKLIGKNKLDAVVSDMAPNATGVKLLDQEAISILAYSVLKFAIKMSKVNNRTVCLIKVWEGGRMKKLESDMCQFYERVSVVKPNASRSNSAETFLLGIGFRGIKAG
ncbi:rRNA methyltransferase 2, mitochondrial isoform X2 [Ischnura elegans]|uniref:rRNA methyltransferase 2, mitochondrial isoform X2 n=1 Tax=Ischnura elegans TaxID=197161 RepID=UPI001ED8728C|nr:rRNA methyltransferase 2, mitochondrial isoform X2 [Ischnura elegans]